MFDDVIVAMSVVALAGIRRMAGADTEAFENEFQRPAKRSGVRKRSEITAAVVFPESSQNKTRKRIARQFHQQKPFVVLEADVVFGPVLLNQFAFEQDRLRLVFYDLDFKVTDGVHQRLQLWLGDCAASGLEVARDPFSKRESLSDVNHPTQAIPHQINAGLVR